MVRQEIPGYIPRRTYLTPVDRMRASIRRANSKANRNLAAVAGPIYPSVGAIHSGPDPAALPTPRTPNEQCPENSLAYSGNKE